MDIILPKGDISDIYSKLNTTLLNKIRASA